MTPNDQTRPTSDQDEDAQNRATSTEEVSDTGGDSDPTAAADSEPTGKAQAAENREDESPS